MIDLRDYEQMLRHVSICHEPRTCGTNFTPAVFCFDEYPIPGEKDALHWEEKFAEAVVA
jgi:hypothetical protein